MCDPTFTRSRSCAVCAFGAPLGEWVKSAFARLPFSLGHQTINAQIGLRAFSARLDDPANAQDQDGRLLLSTRNPTAVFRVFALS